MAAIQYSRWSMNDCRQLQQIHPTEQKGQKITLSLLAAQSHYLGLAGFDWCLADVAMPVQPDLVRLNGIAVTQLRTK